MTSAPVAVRWTGRLAAPPQVVFMRHITVDQNDCWLWNGALDSGGYGKFTMLWDGRLRGMNAHRAAYLLFRGEAPEGHHLDHLCRVRRCANPWHLEPVTPAENGRRALAAQPNVQRGECRHGHALVEGNIYYRSNGARGCRSCRTAARERFRARHGR